MCSNERGLTFDHRPHVLLVLDGSEEGEHGGGVRDSLQAVVRAH